MNHATSVKVINHSHFQNHVRTERRITKTYVGASSRTMDSIGMSVTGAWLALSVYNQSIGFRNGGAGVYGDVRRWYGMHHSIRY